MTQIHLKARHQSCYQLDGSPWHPTVLDDEYGWATFSGPVSCQRSLKLPKDASSSGMGLLSIPGEKCIANIAKDRYRITYLRKTSPVTTKQAIDATALTTIMIEKPVFDSLSLIDVSVRDPEEWKSIYFWLPEGYTRLDDGFCVADCGAKKVRITVMNASRQVGLNWVASPNELLQSTGRSRVKAGAAFVPAPTPKAKKEAVVKKLHPALKCLIAYVVGMFLTHGYVSVYRVPEWSAQHEAEQDEAKAIDPDAVVTADCSTLEGIMASVGWPVYVGSVASASAFEYFKPAHQKPDIAEAFGFDRDKFIDLGDDKKMETLVRAYVQQEIEQAARAKHGEAFKGDPGSVGPPGSPAAWDVLDDKIQSLFEIRESYELELKALLDLRKQMEAEGVVSGE